MATIRKKPTGGWVAQVQHRAKNGLPAISKAAVFPRKADAEAWAAKARGRLANHAIWRLAQYFVCRSVGTLQKRSESQKARLEK